MGPSVGNVPKCSLFITATYSMANKEWNEFDFSAIQRRAEVTKTGICRNLALKDAAIAWLLTLPGCNGIVKTPFFSIEVRAYDRGADEVKNDVSISVYASDPRKGVETRRLFDAALSGISGVPRVWKRTVDTAGVEYLKEFSMTFSVNGQDNDCIVKFEIRAFGVPSTCKLIETRRMVEVVEHKVVCGKARYETLPEVQPTN